MSFTNSSDDDSSHWNATEMQDVVNLQSQLITAFRVSFALVFIITLVGLVANALVIHVILRDRKLRNTVYNVYISSLCISSFLFLLVWGLSDVVIYGVYLHRGTVPIWRDSTIRKIMAGAQGSTMVINCFMITALAVDRYVIIAYPITRQTWRTTKNALIWCGVVWGAGILAACIAIPVDVFTSVKVLLTINITLFVLVYLIPVIIIVVFFFLTIRAAAVKRNSPTISATGKRTLDRQLRFLVLIGCVSLSFIITWGYWHGYYVAIWPLILSRRFYTFHFMVHVSLHMLTDILVILNAALNPFLYTLTRSHMRRHLANLLTCGRKSKNSAEFDVQGEIDSKTDSCSMASENGGVSFHVSNDAVTGETQDGAAIN